MITGFYPLLDDDVFFEREYIFTNLSLALAQNLAYDKHSMNNC